MDSTYNFLLRELVYIADNDELMDGLIEVMSEMRVSLDVEFLNNHSFTNSTYAKQKQLLDQALEAKRLKLKFVRAADFESAVVERDRENKLLDQIEELGFNLLTLDNDDFAIYNISVKKASRKLKLTVYTKSSVFTALLKNIARRVMGNT